MIEGIQFAGYASNVKATGPDLGLALFKEPMNCLSLYTRNKIKAAHILYNRRIESNPIRALLVNSGCANACTGKDGVSDLRFIAGKLSDILGIKGNEILFASTGVIGRRLPSEKIVSALPEICRLLKNNGIESFAQSIMTTDTYPKIVSETVKGKKRYNIIGVAKGAGMINPLFATMLAFVFTDYPVSPSKIKNTFARMGKETFERVTVDGECSTNDTVMLFTKTGDEDTVGLDEFKEKLHHVMKELSLMIVRDGEGATRVIHITVTGAKKKEHAEKIARRIATSPLTKTAFFGCDPNWGRIIAAAGDADVPLQPSKIDIIMQGRQLVKDSIEVPFDEQELKKMMNRKEIELIVDLNDGKASFDIYTTDLTYDYIKINASYRT